MSSEESLVECPVCGRDVSASSIERHVNRCLDGFNSNDTTGDEQQQQQHDNGAPPPTVFQGSVVTSTSTTTNASTIGSSEHSNSNGGTLNSITYVQGQVVTTETNVSSPGVTTTATTTTATPAAQEGASSQEAPTKQDNKASEETASSPTFLDGASDEEKLLALQFMLGSQDAAIRWVAQCDGNVDAAIVIAVQEAQEQQPTSRTHGTRSAEFSSPAAGWYDNDAESDEEVPSAYDRRNNKKATTRDHHVGGSTTTSVEVVVYDLDPKSVGKKFGLGQFHSGIVVHGREYSYGGSPDPSAKGTGLFYTAPYTIEPKIKQKLFLGKVNYSLAEIKAMVKQWGEDEWSVDKYHLLSKNCNHFTEFFLMKLKERLVPGSAPLIDDGEENNNTNSSNGGEKQREEVPFELPTWVNRAARVGDTLCPDFLYKKIMAKVAPPPATTTTPTTPAESSGPSPSSRSVPSTNTTATDRAPLAQQQQQQQQYHTSNALSEEQERVVAQVCCVLPHLPKEDVVDALVAHRFDVDGAVSSLL